MLKGDVMGRKISSFKTLMPQRFIEGSIIRVKGTEVKVVARGIDSIVSPAAKWNTLRYRVFYEPVTVKQ